MAQQEVTFYDLPTKEPRTCWSLNPWKVRLYLNYKQIPYNTVWLEYPEVGPFLQSQGVKPHAKGTAVADYTIPSVKLPDGRLIMESLEIVQELEKLHPEPKLIINPDQANEIRDLFMSCVRRCPGLFIVGTSRNLLAPASKVYFDPSRAKWYNVESIDDIAQNSDLANWGLIETGAKEVGSILRENPAGPFVLGAEVSYTDFVILGVLQWAKTIDAEYYEKIVGFEPALKDLYDASQQWLKRNDH